MTQPNDKYPFRSVQSILSNLSAGLEKMDANAQRRPQEPIRADKAAPTVPALALASGLPTLQKRGAMSERSHLRHSAGNERDSSVAKYSEGFRSYGPTPPPPPSPPRHLLAAETRRGLLPPPSPSH
jgi:hypothetical protein